MADPADPDLADPDLAGPAGEPGASLGTTTLPTSANRPRQTARLLLAAGGGLVVVLIGLGLFLHGQHRTRADNGDVNSPAARVSAPVIADSQSRLTDSASVQRDVVALLRRALPPSGPTFPSRATAPAKDVLLAPALRLDDPALPACAAEIEDGGALLGIDRVSYEGQASLLIVTTGDSDDQALAWVVGPRCAEPGTGGIRTIVTTSR